MDECLSQASNADYDTVLVTEDLIELETFFFFTKLVLIYIKHLRFLIFKLLVVNSSLDLGKVQKLIKINLKLRNHLINY